MVKLIVLILGVAIGFGVGVYWGVHNPADARKLADEEERRFIEAQLKLTKAMKERLDRIASSRAGGSPSGATPGSGFLSGSPRGGSPGVESEIVALEKDQDRQIQELERRLQEVGGK